MRHVRRKGMIWSICLVAVGFMLVAAGTPATGKTTITVALQWNTDVFNGVFPALKEQYEELYPNIEIEYLSGWGTERILTAAVGGALPDIVFGWGNTEAYQTQVFIPHDDLMARHGVSLADYLVGAANQMNIGGTTWSLQVFIDPNFPLIYNKTLFAESGLDPNSPPATVAQFDEMFPTLLRTDADGAITQIALPPWQWTHSHSTFNALTFGSAFGGTFWEGSDQEGRLGLTSPGMVAAYEWIKSYHDQYADAASDLIPRGFGGFVERLTEGQQVMATWITPLVKELSTLAPGYEFDVAPPFYEEQNGIPDPIWFGGWAAGVTRQSQNPDEAFQFLKFMSYDPEGQTILSEVGELFPSTVESPGFLILVEQNPVWYNFIPSVQASTLAPATYWLDLEWGKAFTEADRLIFDEGQSPHTALGIAQEMLELDAAEKGITVIK